jgi:hypothetical protein
MGVFYATRESVKNALDIKETALSNTEVDSAIDAASRTVEGMLHRKFYPWTGTRYFNWPNFQYARSHVLYLEQDELISVNSLTSGGEAIASTDYFLEPVNDGPPYTRIELDLDASAAFGQGTTAQRDVAITGVFGHSTTDLVSGTLNEALDASETAVNVSDSYLIGIGSIIKVESERMIVTEKVMQDTTVDIDAGDSLTASVADVSMTVSTSVGILPKVGEILLIDSERVLVTDIAGLVVTIKRAVDGSVLASHAGGAAIYAPRTLTVTRAALGTSAATHADTTAITRHEVPSLIAEFTTALALNTLLQRSSGYARESGSGDGTKEFTGRSISQIKNDAMTTYGRMARIGAI